VFSYRSRIEIGARATTALSLMLVQCSACPHATRTVAVLALLGRDKARVTEFAYRSITDMLSVHINVR
jgi:hypothetical protein